MWRGSRLILLSFLFVSFICKRKMSPCGSWDCCMSGVMGSFRKFRRMNNFCRSLLCRAGPRLLSRAQDKANTSARRREQCNQSTEARTGNQSSRLRESGCISRVCLAYIPLSFYKVPSIESTKVDAQSARGKARLQLGHMRRTRTPAISPTDQKKKKKINMHQKERGEKRELTWRRPPLR